MVAMKTLAATVIFCSLGFISCNSEKTAPDKAGESESTTSETSESTSSQTETTTEEAKQENSCEGLSICEGVESEVSAPEVKQENPSEISSEILVPKA